MVNAPTLGRSQLTRLLRIVLELRGDRTPNSRQLADLCEVSRRTIFRDLETIERSGLRVAYDARRLGYRLAAPVAMIYHPLDESEAIALFLLARAWDRTDESDLAALANAGALKLIASLSDARRTRLEAIVATSSDRPASSPLRGDRQPIYDRLLEGILQGVSLRLKVRGDSETVATFLTVTPLRLAYDHGWRLIVRSSPDRGLRAIAIPSVEEVVCTDEAAIVPPRLGMVLGRELKSPRADTEVVLRMELEATPLLLEAGWTPTWWSEPCPKGRVELSIAIHRPDELVAWCLGQGDRVEVLFPSELRSKIKEAAGKIVLRYAGDEHQAAPTPIETEFGPNEGGFVVGPNPDFARVGG